MKINMKWYFLVTALTITSVSIAHAEKAGTWMLEGGVTNIVPDDSSGNLTAPSFVGATGNVLSAAQASVTVAYMFTDHISVAVPLALPFKHDMIGDGAVNGVGKLGTVKALPMTVFAQYRFSNPDITPYIGLGATYAYFFDTKGTAVLSALTGGAPTTLKVDSKFAVTPQIGMTVRINDKWYLDFMYAKTFIKTTSYLSTGQSLPITLNPDSYTFQIGYKF